MVLDDAGWCWMMFYDTVRSWMLRQWIWRWYLMTLEMIWTKARWCEMMLDDGRRWPTMADEMLGQMSQAGFSQIPHTGTFDNFATHPKGQANFVWNLMFHSCLSWPSARELLPMKKRLQVSNTFLPREKRTRMRPSVLPGTTERAEGSFVPNRFALVGRRLRQVSWHLLHCITILDVLPSFPLFSYSCLDGCLFPRYLGLTKYPCNGGGVVLPLESVKLFWRICKQLGFGGAGVWSTAPQVALPSQWFD